MSEYQYYEFVAVDRPLLEEQQRALRALSTRARIRVMAFEPDHEHSRRRGSGAIMALSGPTVRRGRASGGRA
jgi:hypothetical protein